MLMQMTDCLHFVVCFIQKHNVKLPVIANVYRNIPISGSRQPATVENLQKSIKNSVKFAMTFENYMRKIDFFVKYPEYKYKVIDCQLFDCDLSVFMKYYPSSQTVHSDVIKFANEQIEKIFGKNAPFVQWLFHRYHLFQRNHM